MKNLNEINVGSTSKILTSTLQELGLEDIYYERTDRKVAKVLQKFCAGKLKDPEPVERLEEVSTTDIPLYEKHIGENSILSIEGNMVDNYFDRLKNDFLDRLKKNDIEPDKVLRIEIQYGEDYDSFEVKYKAPEPEWKYEERLKIADFTKTLLSRSSEIYAVIDSKVGQKIKQEENDIDAQIRKLQEQKAQLRQTGKLSNKKPSNT